MPNFPREHPSQPIDIEQALIGTADELLCAKFGPIPPRFLDLGFKTIIRQLRRGVPGIRRAPRQARAHFLARQAGHYMFTGQYPRAMQRIIRALRDSPYDCRLWRQAAVQLWDIWDIEAIDLSIELLEFAHWINPGNPEVKEDLEEFTFMRDEDDEDDSEDWLNRP